jgi:hypothetical protein
MSTFLSQASFQFGEVSELLFARFDSPIYNRAARRMRNVITIPQGGCEVRFGTEYIEAVRGSVTNYLEAKGVIFDYQDSNRYLMVFRENAIDVYRNDAWVQTVVTTYTAAEIEDLSISQSSNLMFVAHGDHEPAILRRDTTAHDSWILNAAPTWTNYPTFDFDQNYDTLTFQIKVAGVVITTAQNLLGQDVTIHSSAAIFTADHEKGLFFADSGTLRITAFTSDVQVSARIIAVFDPDSALFHGGNTVLGTEVVLTEKAFSANRGWPEKVSFFQNRLFFARTQSLPGGLFGSNYNGFTYNSFNFDDSEALDTSALSTVIYNRRSVLIEHMVSYKSLLIFTTSGLYSTPLLEDFPLTPRNMAFINLQTADSSSGVDPQILDNQVLFYDKGGKKVKDINLLDRTGTYVTNNISVMAPHLIDQPNSSGVYENSTEKDGSWLLTTMSGSELDGGLSIYQSVPEQEITAWTHSTTLGKFRAIIADEALVYFFVEREINGSTVLYIEKLSWDVRTDSAKVVTGTAMTTVTGLSHLEGETVRVKGDGAVQESKTVTAGEITLDYAVDEVEVGLNYIPLVVPMPLNIPTQIGNSAYFPKTVKRIFIDYYDSVGIEVNGQLIPPIEFDTDTYDTAITPKTNFYSLSPMNGWEPRQQFTITQTDPMPFTLIGVGFVLDF